jgi:hypothetical protein
VQPTMPCAVSVCSRACVTGVVCRDVSHGKHRHPRFFTIPSMFTGALREFLRGTTRKTRFKTTVDDDVLLELGPWRYRL